MALFAQDFLLEMVLPFVLLFVVTFAVLEKSKLLGDAKHQINALVSMVLGAMLISFPTPRDIMVSILPWFSVGIAVLLVFFLLYGFFGSDLSKGAPKSIKITLGIMTGIFTLCVVIFTTGLDKIISRWAGANSQFFLNSFIVLIVIGVIVWVILSSKGQSSSSS